MVDVFKMEDLMVADLMVAVVMEEVLVVAVVDIFKMEDLMVVLLMVVLLTVALLMVELLTAVVRHSAIMDLYQTVNTITIVEMKMTYVNVVVPFTMDNKALLNS